MKNQLKNKFRNFILEYPFLNPYGFTFDRMIRNLTCRSRLLPDAIIVGNNKNLYGFESKIDFLHVSTIKIYENLSKKFKH